MLEMEKQTSCVVNFPGLNSMESDELRSKVKEVNT